MSLLTQDVGERRPRRRGRARASRIAGSLLLVQTAWAGSSGAGPGSRAVEEYELKAVFLLNFTRYVEWPREAFPTPDAPITICVLGEDPFGRNLDAILQEERIGPRRVTARRCGDLDEVERCHILFVPRSESDRLGRSLADLAGKSILTVGESEGPAGPSAMIRFMIADSRVRLQVDVEAARAAGLTISSKLLRQVEIVRSGAR